MSKAMGGGEGEHAVGGADPEDEYRDELPEDLDAAGYVGPYTFPDNNRRRITAAIYLATSLVLFALWATRASGGVLVNRGFLVLALFLLAFAVYCLAAGQSLAVKETDALVAATRHVGFPVGHASAQLGWRGLLSRPTWRILLYSADEPPTKRGLVQVDGLDGQVLESSFVEANPEDWSKLPR